MCKEIEVVSTELINKDGSVFNNLLSEKTKWIQSFEIKQMEFTELNDKMNVQAIQFENEKNQLVKEIEQLNNEFFKI